MKLVSSLIAQYCAWIREPIAPHSLGLFRCWFGVICLANILFLWPDMEMWLGADGVIAPSVTSISSMEPGLSLYRFFSDKDTVLELIRAFGLMGSLALVLGVYPRCGATMLWLAWVSIEHRNVYILNSGDTLARITLFFLIFARSDQAFSLTRWLQTKSGKIHPSEHPTIPAWPVRILQAHLCIIYISTAIWKSLGSMWMDGSAVGVVLQLGEFSRFPVPSFLATETSSKILTWMTLAIEFSFPILVWIPRYRTLTLASGIALHVGLEWIMNIQLFQWTITSLYILFLTPSLGELRFLRQSGSTLTGVPPRPPSARHQA
jgi:hypothetical protein